MALFKNNKKGEKEREKKKERKCTQEEKGDEKIHLSSSVLQKESTALLDRLCSCSITLTGDGGSAIAANISPHKEEEEDGKIHMTYCCSALAIYEQEWEKISTSTASSSTKNCYLICLHPQINK